MSDKKTGSSLFKELCENYVITKCTAEIIMTQRPLHSGATLNKPLALGHIGIEFTINATCPSICGNDRDSFISASGRFTTELPEVLRIKSKKTCLPKWAIEKAIADSLATKACEKFDMLGFFFDSSTKEYEAIIKFFLGKHSLEDAELLKPYQEG